MTDERQGEALFDAIGRLPRGAGIVFRHHATPWRERRALFERARRIARRRGLTLIVAGDARLARRLRAEGFHERSARIGPRGLIRTVAVHDAREMIFARRASADLVFVSPVFPTRSHPSAEALGRVRFGSLVRRSPIPVIALGGVDAQRARSLMPFGIHGWAAIDSWSKGSGRHPSTSSGRAEAGASAG